MHRQLACHLETKLRLSLSWMHLTGRHLFHVSKYARSGAIVISFLIGSNASCCDLTYAKTTPLWRSALSGAVKSAIFGRK